MVIVIITNNFIHYTVNIANGYDYKELHKTASFNTKNCPSKVNRINWEFGANYYFLTFTYCSTICSSDPNTFFEHLLI